MATEVGESHSQEDKIKEHKKSWAGVEAKGERWGKKETLSPWPYSTASIVWLLQPITRHHLCLGSFG